MRHTPAALALLLFLGCDKSGSSNNPGIVDSVANDVESTVDDADETAEGVSNDVSDTVDQAGDTVEGAGDDVAETVDDL